MSTEIDKIKALPTKMTVPWAKNHEFDNRVDPKVTLFQELVGRLEAAEARITQLETQIAKVTAKVG